MQIYGKLCYKCNNLSFQVFLESFRKSTYNFSNQTKFSRSSVDMIGFLPFSQKSFILPLIESRSNGPHRLYGHVYMIHVSDPTNQITVFQVYVLSQSITTFKVSCFLKTGLTKEPRPVWIIAVHLGKLPLIG